MGLRLAIAALAVLAFIRVEAIPFAAPWFVVWAASPLVAWWLSQPRTAPTMQLSQSQQHFLEKLSRKCCPGL